MNLEREGSAEMDYKENEMYNEKVITFILCSMEVPTLQVSKYYGG